MAKDKPGWFWVGHMGDGRWDIGEYHRTAKRREASGFPLKKSELLPKRFL